MKIISGRSNEALARSIADLVNIRNVTKLIKTFEDGELRIQILENLSNEDVVIIQSTSRPSNDNLMELLLLADSAKRSGAKSIIALIPYFGYARQDRKSYNYGPISASMVATILEAVSINRIITMDLHSQQIEGFFKIPTTNLDPISIVTPYIQNDKNYIIVSPDVGGLGRARKFATYLNTDLAIINKIRNSADQCSMNEVIGTIENRHCLLIDDIVDSGNTLCKACDLLIKRGALTINAFVTHGVLSGDSANLVQNSSIDHIWITDTIKQKNLPSKFTIIPTSSLFAKELNNKF
jgi:ribose-phosphate pyrophosphokinase